MNQPTPLSTLDARIQAARKGVRACQPLDFRVELVRKHHAIQKRKAERNGRIPSGKSS